jgi:hypothetical protein
MRRASVVLAAAASLAGAAASAQEAAPTRPRLFGTRILRLDSVAVGLRSAHAWRGFFLGDTPVGGAADLTLWHIDGVQDRHALTARAAADVPLTDRDGGHADHYQVGGGYRFRLDTEQGELHVGAVARIFAGEVETQATSEVAASVQRRFDVPLTELRPLFGVRLARDFQRLDVTYVEPHATLDFGLPPKDDGAYSIGGAVRADEPVERPPGAVGRVGGLRAPRDVARAVGLVRPRVDPRRPAARGARRGALVVAGGPRPEPLPGRAAGRRPAVRR